MRSVDFIYQDVVDCLTQHGSIDASNIGVEVDNGVVTLDVGAANVSSMGWPEPELSGPPPPLRGTSRETGS